MLALCDQQCITGCFLCLQRQSDHAGTHTAAGVLRRNMIGDIGAGSDDGCRTRCGEPDIGRCIRNGISVFIEHSTVHNDEVFAVCGKLTVILYLEMQTVRHFCCTERFLGTEHTAAVSLDRDRSRLIYDPPFAEAAWLDFLHPL